MALTIKTRLLLQSLLTIAIALALVVAMVSVALWRQGTSQAHDRLAQGMQVMAGTLTDTTTRLREAALRISSDKELSSKAGFLQENAAKADMASMVVQERAALALRTGHAMAAAGAADAAIYTSEGGLLCASAADGERLLLLIVGEDRHLVGVALAAGQEPQPKDWQPAQPLPNVPLTFPRLQPTQAGAGLILRHSAWRAEATAPLMVEGLNPATFQMDLIQRGVLLLGRPINHAFLTSEEEQLGLRICLYAGTTLAAGTAAGYQPATFPTSSASAPDHGLDHSALTRATTGSGDDAYFVALSPLLVDGKAAGAIALFSSQSDIRRGLRLTILLTMAAGGIAMLIAALVGLVMTRAITRPLGGTVDVLNAMAAGDVSRRLPESGPRELADLARAVNATIGGMQRTLDRTATIAASLSTDAGCLEGTATTAATTAEHIASRAATAAGQAENVSAAVQTVATAATQMAASIQEIARNSSNASQVASDGVTAARQAEESVSRLEASSRTIDDVVKTISAIAGQTNLLALNATIEAARAGESGRGFAVVAAEVKALARQSAAAAQDVGQRIHALQTDAATAATDIHQIDAIIRRISDLQTAVAAAVEQQASTTVEITRSAEGASHGASTIASVVGEVAQAAASGQAGAAQTRAAAERLLRLAAELNQVAGAAPRS